MSVTRSRLRAHAVEWHVAPASHLDSRHRADFLELQRRCNSELCRHAALTHNLWLDRIEAATVPFAALIGSLQQFAIFLRQLALARERHALLLTEGQALMENGSGTAVVICFDEAGVPWCPPLPGMGLGDPYILSERLYAWWSAWRHVAPEIPQDWCLQQGTPATRQLCDLIETGYNAPQLSTALGVMLALENGVSTDFWQRLSRGLRQCCDNNGLPFPDAGFFPVAETHARLQARHGLYLLEAACVSDQVDVETFFTAGMQALEKLADFWKAQAENLQTLH